MLSTFDKFMNGLCTAALCAVIVATGALLVIAVELRELRQAISQPKVAMSVPCSSGRSVAVPTADGLAMTAVCL